MFGDINLQDIIIRTIAVLVAIIPHEMAHGYAAYLCGDETAKNDDRLSLNPLHHLDPIGTICLIFFKFGWAKPVMINPNNFRDRKKGTFFVSIAGVLTNFILAINVFPKSLIPLSVAKSLSLSLWCNPIDGSSRMYRTPTSPDPICVARRIRCASPPESVVAVLPNVR